MKRLSRLPGYPDSEIKRFNQIYNGLLESKNRIIDGVSAQELNTFQAYVILAEADEDRRREALLFKRRVIDFSREEVQRFEHMQEVLEEFNRLVGDDDIEIELILPGYSDIEMIELSQYQEICQDQVVRNWRKRNKINLKRSE